MRKIINIFRQQIFAVSCLAMLLFVLGCQQKSENTGLSAELKQAAKDAYIFSYPMVMM